MNGRIKRGDVEAVLNASGTGGRVILRKGRAVEAAPADFFGSHGSIRPFKGSMWDNRHFCADDRHVILIAEIDGGDKSFSRQQAEASLGQVRQSFKLDGAPLVTDRKPIKRFLNPEGFDLEEAYFFQEGRIMSPGDLGVGRHDLSVTITDEGEVLEDGITFFIDAGGTGACTGD